MCKDSAQPTQNIGKKLGIYSNLCTYVNNILISGIVSHVIVRTFYYNFPLPRITNIYLLYSQLYRFYTLPTTTTTLINNRRIA